MHRVLWAMLWAAGCADAPSSSGSALPDDSGLGADSGTTDTPSAAIVPLFDADTTLEPDGVFERDGAIVTRFADRGRDRHAREDEFQSYDHYLPRYWEYRTARVQLVDRVASGGVIEVSIVTEWKLSVAEFRAWYIGTGTVATYGGNYANLVTSEGPGVYDDDHERISDDGDQYRYTLTIDSAITLDGATVALESGQFMEMEISQFLDGVPSGRANYYGTALLYEVGVGGLVPWYAEGDISDGSSERENSHRLDETAWLGGRTTLPYQYSDEPDSHYMQMATNIAQHSGQPFVLGRRVHHTDMVTGAHDESDENGTFDALAGLAGPLYVNTSCDSCHTRNGRASVAEIGEPLDRWVFKIGTAEGAADPARGAVLQPTRTSGDGEGSVTIAEWVETDDDLRYPVYAFSASAPASFSARLTPSLVGMGLLEAVPESAVLERADPDDGDGDGISGRAQLSVDPETGDIRLGRFGWKAGAGSLRHQIASALNTDMGVMTSILAEPDCGSEQSDCGNSDGAELEDEALDNLVRYVALLGVRARRDINDPDALDGEDVFAAIGCEDCHRATLITSSAHPLAELRSQTIHPYSDLLLHDMGEGLADTLGEGVASGAEWRTTPLWGIGLSACVTGGVEGAAQSKTCAPDTSYLHDGRARSLTEAIRWHGGEGAASRDAFIALSDDEQDAVLTFLESL